MAKRSISGDEIALIKAMLARGMKSKDIQFLFNRPDRAVNSGRISGIRDGKYGPSAKIKPATDDAVDAFIQAHSSPTDIGAVAVPAASDVSRADPLDHGTIKSLFSEKTAGSWAFSAGETDTHECKSSFGLKHPQAWLRAIAALSNNSGGYVFFGVNDSLEVIGMKSDEFDKVDPATLSKRVRSVFDPTPKFRTTVIELGGHRVGVIYVERHQSRPTIAVKQDGDKISEGDIFYRYPGQSARIKYSDLRAMLDARDKESRAQILPMVEKLLTLGPRRSLVADLQDGTIGDGQSAIEIDAALVDKLSFIKEGHFVETDGDPTLRLIGDVQPVGGTILTKTEFGLLTREGVRNAFLDQATPANPEEYIRFAVEVGSGKEWFPMHYFAHLAGMQKDELIAFISNTAGSDDRKMLCINRAKTNAAFKIAVGKPKSILDELVAGKLPTVSSAQDASQVGQAVCALPNDFEVQKMPMLALLKECLPLLEGKSSVSFVRRAICRADELLFSGL